MDRKDEQDEVQKLRGEREMQTCARRPDTSVAPCAVLRSCGRLTPRGRGAGREGLFTVNTVNEDSERDPATLVEEKEEALCKAVVTPAPNMIV